MKFSGRLLTKTSKIGHFSGISVDCAHTNLHIVTEVNMVINHHVFYYCAEFERNRQSFRGHLSAKTAHNLSFSNFFLIFSHLASLFQRFIERNLNHMLLYMS
jgi:hypothetical protein